MFLFVCFALFCFVGVLLLFSVFGFVFCLFVWGGGGCCLFVLFLFCFVLFFVFVVVVCFCFVLFFASRVDSCSINSWKIDTSVEAHSSHLLISKHFRGC